MSDASPPSDSRDARWAAGVALYLAAVVVAAPTLLGPWAADWFVRAAITCALVAPAWVWFARRPAWNVADADRRGGWPALGAIVALAAVAWGWRLDDFPALLHLDAGLNAAMALDLAKRPWTPYSLELGVGTESTFFYGMAAFIAWLGLAPWVIRLAGVLAMLGFLVALFGFVRALLGRRVALLAALGVALSPGLNEMARTPQHHLLVPGALCLALWATLAAFARGGVARYVLAGALLGSHAYLYHGYRANALANPLLVPLAALVLRGADRPRDLGRGAIALAVAYLVVVAPAARFAARHTEVWMTPLSQQTIGDPPPLVERLIGACEVLAIALVDRPGEDPRGFSPLAILGLAALPLALRSRGLAGLVLGWIALTHLLPPMVPWQHRSAPRRFVGLLPILAILPALGWLEVRRALDVRGRRVWTVLGLAAAIALAAASKERITRAAPADAPEAERYRVLRAVLSAVESHPDWTAYVPTAYHLHGFYNLRYFFEHPRIVELDGDDVLGIAPARDALWIETGTALDGRVARLYPAARPRSFDLPAPGPSGVVTARLIPRVQLRAARASGLGDVGWLAVPRTGRWRIELAAGARGRLLLQGEDDATPRLALRATGAATSVELALVRGCYRYVLERALDSAPWRAAWRLLAGGSPGPASALEAACRRSTLEARPLLVRRPVPWEIAFERTAPIELSAAGPRPQDVVRVTGGWLIALAERVVRWGDDGACDAAFALRDGKDEPLELALGYGVPQPKTLALAATPDDGVVVSCRDGRWVRRFDATGAYLAEVGVGAAWGEPLDVACSATGELAVADRARGHVRVFDPTGRELHAVACEPIAVEYMGNAIVAICERERALLVIEGGAIVSRVALDGFDRASRVVAAGARLVVTHRRRIRLYDDRLRPLSVGGDPTVLDPPADCGDVVGAAWDEAASVLALATEFGHLERLRGRPRPWPDEWWDEGTDRAGTELADGNLNTEPTDFGSGLAIDGGERPARGAYELDVPTAGRYVVWLLQAAGEPRGLSLEVAGQRIDWPGAATGGFGRDHLAWSRAGELELPAGPVALDAVAHELFPTLARIKLVASGP